MRRPVAVPALFVVSFIALGAAHSQQPLPPDSAIRAIIRDRVDSRRSAGIVVGTLDPGGGRRVIGYGPGPNGEPLGRNSVFEIGSITKTFTATILADMVAKGEVRLDDPVSKYLPPSVHVPSRNGRQITLLDLATQSSGLPGMPSNFTPKDQTNPYADYSVQQMYDFISAYQLPRDVGEKYEYSNLGVGLLGHALALRAGMSYEDLVRSRVLTPLGMNDTRVTLTPAMRSHLAPGHDEAGNVVANWDIPTLAGAGALRSTVDDMLKYLAANLDSSSRPLGPQMHQAHIRRHDGPAPTLSLGLAWHILTAPSGGQIVWHNGGTGGYRTFIGFDQARKAGVVVLSNSASSVDDIGFHLIDPMLPLQPAARQHKEITLAPDALERYVGDYELAPTFHLTVTREGSALYAQATGQQKLPLFPESETDFFLKVIDAQVTFVKDASGKVTGLVLHQGGQSSPGAKVK